jgi:hypothetical protein
MPGFCLEFLPEHCLQGTEQSSEKSLVLSDLANLEANSNLYFAELFVLGKSA